LSLDFLLISKQDGSLEEATKAKEAGVDGIIVQGREAGGSCNWSGKCKSISFSFVEILLGNLSVSIPLASICYC